MMWKKVNKDCGGEVEVEVLRRDSFDGELDFWVIERLDVIGQRLVFPGRSIGNF
jgi:hypothetical protein